MANFDISRILVDHGSFVEIMYSELFKTLQLDDFHLTPYVGSNLQDFNDTTTKSQGYVEQTRNITILILIYMFQHSNSY